MSAPQIRITLDDLQLKPQTLPTTGPRGQISALVMAFYIARLLVDRVEAYDRSLWPRLNANLIDRLATICYDVSRTENAVSQSHIRSEWSATYVKANAVKNALDDLAYMSEYDTNQHLPDTSREPAREAEIKRYTDLVISLTTELSADLDRLALAYDAEFPSDTYLRQARWLPHHS